MKNNYNSTQFNHKKHHRRSIRLKGYDYSQEGFYFLTICTQYHLNLFGHIKNGEMILNDAGKMVEYWYYALANKYTDLKCHEMVIMPNHFHCIIEIIVGANLCVRPETGRNVGLPLPSTPISLGQRVQWFKTMTTNFYIHGVKNNGWAPFHGRLWQRNYWERIIRNNIEYEFIAQYIINNPQQWQNDQFIKFSP